MDEPGAPTRHAKEGILKILQVISGREVNGALVYCKLLSEILASRGHQLSILTRPKSWMLDQHYSQDIHLFESSLARFPLTQLRRISRWIRENNIDVIHTHMTRGHSFGVLLKMMTGVPVIATAHSRHFQLHWTFNDFVIANSTATRDYHLRVNRIPADRMETVHACTDLERFANVTRRDVNIVRRELGFKPDDIVMGVVGEVVARKGQQFLFDALPRILRSVPNLKLVVLGRFHRRETYVKKLRQTLVEHQLFGKTKWLGRRENVQDFMTAFDFTVVPSLEEPLGLVAIESLAAGTPVIASNTGGLPEIIQHDSTGLLVPPRDAEALAEGVIRLASDQSLRHRLGSVGRSFVINHFSPERLVSQVERIFERVVAQQSQKNRTNRAMQKRAA